MMRRVCVLLQALCLSTIAFAEEMVVIESTSPDYLVGDILDTEVNIVLAEDAGITLISEDGMVINLTGPYTGSIAIDGTNDVSGALDALGQLVGYAETDARDIGGVRGDGNDDEFFATEIVDQRTSSWLLHTGITGRQCIRAGSQNVAYWREKRSVDDMLEVRRVTSGETVSVRWTAGTDTLSWPDSMPIQADEMYLLRFADQLRSTNVLLREVPAAVAENDMATIAFLAAKGCFSQARLELDLVATSNRTE